MWEDILKEDDDDGSSPHDVERLTQREQYEKMHTDSISTLKDIQEELEKIHTKITESSVQSEAYYSGVNSSMGELLDRIDKLYMVVLGKSRW